MKKYLNKIELVKNFRGVWDLDPFKGCTNAKTNNNKGCYGICYAAKIAKSRGYDFSDVVKRYFINNKHFYKIKTKLEKIPFVRLGVMCDPSFDWEHTLNIIDKIRPYQKNIVIVTKHWNILTPKQINRVKGLIINTSICALDSEEQRNMRLCEYNRLKKYCKSVLRVNTADFNDLELNEIQNRLLNNINIIDNILRFPKNHELVKKGVINIKKYKFLNTFVYASKHNEKTFFSYCDSCLDFCGATRNQYKLKQSKLNEIGFDNKACKTLELNTKPPKKNKQNTIQLLKWNANDAVGN